MYEVNLYLEFLLVDQLTVLDGKPPPTGSERCEIRMLLVCERNMKKKKNTC